MTIRDLKIQQFANQAQLGALRVGGTDWEVFGVTAKLNHGAGIKVDKDADRANIHDGLADQACLVRADQPHLGDVA